MCNINYIITYSEKKYRNQVTEVSYFITNHRVCEDIFKLNFRREAVIFYDVLIVFMVFHFFTVFRREAAIFLTVLFLWFFGREAADFF